MLQSQYIDYEYQIICKLLKPRYKLDNEMHLLLPCLPVPPNVDFVNVLQSVKERLEKKGFKLVFRLSTPRGIMSVITWTPQKKHECKNIVETETTEIRETIETIETRETTETPQQADAITETRAIETIETQETEETQTRDQKTSEENVTTIGEEKTQEDKGQVFCLDSMEDRLRLRLRYLEMRAKELDNHI